MKQLLTVLFAVMLVTSCHKASKNDLAKEEMTFEQISALIGKDNAFKAFEFAGKTETSARGGKVKANATLVVWTNDLTLTVSSTGAITYTTSANANWGGCQSFPEPMINDGAYAVWSCQRFWPSGTAPEATVSCSDTPTGVRNYRAFTSDHDYTIHVSNLVQISN